MSRRRRFEIAIDALNDGADFSIARGADEHWAIVVNGVTVATITQAQRDYIVRGQQIGPNDTLTAESANKDTQNELSLAIRYLMITPSTLTNVDAAVAELVMGWARSEDQPNCGCLTYHSANNERTFFIPQNRDAGCQTHEIWSPSTNLTATQELYEKPFACLDGRFLAVRSVNIQGTAALPRQAAGQPIKFGLNNMVSGRTTITFSNAGRTEQFDVVDEVHLPPVAVCTAILKQMGLNVAPA